jgi:hypothetical protein
MPGLRPSPWGGLIELVSYPDGVAYPDDAPTTHWTPPASA